MIKDTKGKSILTAPTGYKLIDSAPALRGLWTDFAARSGTPKPGPWPLDIPEFRLADWLTGVPDAVANVAGGLSVILNSVIRQGTLEPFDIFVTFADHHIMAEVRGLGDRVPAWFYTYGRGQDDLQEFFLCLPELFATRDPASTTWILKSHDDLIPVLQSFRFLRIHHRYAVNEFKLDPDGDKVIVGVTDNVVIVPYIRGAVCGCVPVPGKPPHSPARKEPEHVNSPEVVASSPAVREALEALSRIWQDRRAKSVLISSPPGSGKETLANSVPYGNGRSADNLCSLSMASADQLALERRLFGFADGTSAQDGLMARAAKSALFLDEVHHPDGEKTSIARASLLRALEAGTYFPVGSLEERKINDVLFVFATSKTPEELSAYQPVDFWTRMTHALVAPHPLDFIADEDQPSVGAVLAHFFKFFWWDMCDSHFGMSPCETGDNSKEDSRHLVDRRQQESLLSVLYEGQPEDCFWFAAWAGYRPPATPPGGQARSTPDRFAGALLRLLRRHRLRAHELSVRGIRNIVSRLFAIAATDVAQGRTPWPMPEGFEQDVTTIFSEVVHVARLR